MDAGAVAAALEDARFDARQASRHEDLVGDVRGPAELAEWERIDQPLAAAPAGTVYDPDTDDVVRAELAAAAAREAELREAARVAARADELQALRELHALASHRGHYRDPAAREEAAGLLTPPALAHAALLAELARLVPDADVDQLAFAARLATAEPEAACELAVLLASALVLLLVPRLLHGASRSSAAFTHGPVSTQVLLVQQGRRAARACSSATGYAVAAVAGAAPC